MPQINKIKYATLSVTASMRSGAGPVISMVGMNDPFVLLLLRYTVYLFYLLCGECYGTHCQVG